MSFRGGRQQAGLGNKLKARFNSFTIYYPTQQGPPSPNWLTWDAVVWRLQKREICRLSQRCELVALIRNRGKTKKNEVEDWAKRCGGDKAANFFDAVDISQFCSNLELGRQSTTLSSSLHRASIYHTEAISSCYCDNIARW